MKRPLLFLVIVLCGGRVPSRPSNWSRAEEVAMRRTVVLALVLMLLAALPHAGPALAQLIDRTQNPNTANAGIAKSLAEQIGAGRGDVNTPDSSAFIIARDPARAVRRGRQIFQRKFLGHQGQGPLFTDGDGDINTELRLGAGLMDSCAGCHGRPKGSAGSGGDVATRPDSRDAPHLFGLGLKEMLADEITADLRAIRDDAVHDRAGAAHLGHQAADQQGHPLRRHHGARRRLGGCVRGARGRSRPARATVLPARWDHLDARVRGGRVPGRDGAAGRRSRSRRRVLREPDRHPGRHGARRLEGRRRVPAHGEPGRGPRRRWRPERGPRRVSWTSWRSTC